MTTENATQNISNMYKALQNKFPGTYISIKIIFESNFTSKNLSNDCPRKTYYLYIDKQYQKRLTHWWELQAAVKEVLAVQQVNKID